MKCPLEKKGNQISLVKTSDVGTSKTILRHYSMEIFSDYTRMKKRSEISNDVYVRPAVFEEATYTTFLLLYFGDNKSFYLSQFYDIG